MIKIKTRFRKLLKNFAYFLLVILFIDLADVTFFYIHCKEYAEPLQGKFDAAVVFFS